MLCTFYWSCIATAIRRIVLLHPYYCCALKKEERCILTVWSRFSSKTATPFSGMWVASLVVVVFPVVKGILKTNWQGKQRGRTNRHPVAVIINTASHKYVNSVIYHHLHSCLSANLRLSLCLCPFTLYFFCYICSTVYLAFPPHKVTGSLGLW